MKVTEEQLLRWKEQASADQMNWVRGVNGITDVNLESYQAGLAQGWALAVSTVRLHEVDFKTRA
jgi:hypothetical protein